MDGRGCNSFSVASEKGLFPTVDIVPIQNDI